MISYFGVAFILWSAAQHWWGYLIGKSGSQAKLDLMEQQSEELCPRCGWRLLAPGVLGQGKDACYNCDCEKIADYRRSGEFSNLGRH